MTFAFLHNTTRTPKQQTARGGTKAGEGIFLRPPQITDYAMWSEIRATSRAFLKPWEPSWASDDLTRNAFRRRIRRYQQETREGQAHALFIFRKHDEQLVGGLNLSNIRRGVTQAVNLGYWMGESFAGQGYMSAAVRSTLPFAFNSLGLHRVEAACIPDNLRSINLLQRLGFQREGYAREYLCIDGRWRDHVLFAILKKDLNKDT
uniref:GNAT family N-acetyltransferase n=1 Tax=Pararhizobium sp. IMCC3301 TaxID=3067904 RepID=UPI0027408A7B|nr:GNAT family protein [Pararhizobium sp. IMCC3301]